MARPAPCVLVGQPRLGPLWRRDQSDALSPAQRMLAAPVVPGELQRHRITVQVTQYRLQIPLSSFSWTR